MISKGLATSTMSLQHTKNLLNKISALHNSVEIDGKVSGIERDLMLSYTRQFYEFFLTISDEPVAPPPPLPAPVAKPAPVVVETPKLAPVVVAPVVEKVIIPPPAPVVVETPKPAPIVVEYIPTEVIILPTPSTPVPIVPKVEEVKVEPVRVVPPTVFPEPPKPKAAAKPLIKPANGRVEQSELFEEKMSKELSDKLGETSLDDIKKGMGLNERVIFLKDLFNGKQEDFDAAVNTLNNSGSFEVARRELAELAAKYDWASKAHQAKPFIRLVRRRYN